MRELYYGYEYPTTNIEEILLTLITKGKVSLFDYPVLAGFRTRCSELINKHNIQLKTIKDTRCNKFGNTFTYHIHFLPTLEKEKAINLYKQLNKHYK